jgi:DNA-binding NtrC family response regulator
MFTASSGVTLRANRLASFLHPSCEIAFLGVHPCYSLRLHILIPVTLAICSPVVEASVKPDVQRLESTPGAPTMTQPRARILVVDDDGDVVEACRRILSRRGYRLETTASDAVALRLSEDGPFDLLLVDMVVSHNGGPAFVHEASRRNGALPILLITEQESTERSRYATRDGAFEYLGKPFSAQDLEVAVERSLARRSTLEKDATSKPLRESDFNQIIGCSPAMRHVVDMVRKVADVEASILLVGESGTGKELIARAIHANSRRRERAFVPLDCCSLPETLLESEMFGAERGAYTGAVGRRAGLIEHAEGGTLFLDEICNLPVAMQAKLLRVLEERAVRRLGSTRLIPCDMRLVTASNQDLWALTQERGFREDLYYRINVVCIVVPPLRERRGDVRLLAEHLLTQLAARQRKPIEGISSAAMMLLEHYNWPGNVRELRNAIERAISLAESNEITPGDLPPTITDGRRARPVLGPFRAAKELSIADFEVAYLRALLLQSAGNISRAAATAGLRRTALHRLLNRHRLDARQFRSSR